MVYILLLFVAFLTYEKVYGREFRGVVSYRIPAITAARIDGSNLNHSRKKRRPEETPTPLEWGLLFRIRPRFNPSVRSARGVRNASAARCSCRLRGGRG